MRSIRARIGIYLTLLLLIAWVFMAGSTYLETRHEVEEVLDAELAQSSGIIARLADAAAQGNGDALLGQPVYGHGYERNIGFQLWRDGRLLLRSQTAPSIMLATADGFADVRVDEQEWRVFRRSEGPLVVITAESYAPRRELVGNILRAVLLPVLLLALPVALAMWLAVGAGLAPLARVTHALQTRSRERLDALEVGPVPPDLQPLTAAIDELLARLRAAFERESRFTSDAAHELRTPLASLRTQAQVARRARDEAERMRALDKVIEAVDNGTRVIQQLLTLARVEGPAALADAELLAPGPLVDELLADGSFRALRSDVTLRARHGDGIDGCLVHGSRAGIAILLRNLVENAVRHSPPQGVVQIGAHRAGARLVLEVIDEGPGVPPAERERVFERFYRGRPVGYGAGLGLSIVRRIVELHAGSVALADGPEGRGLAVRIELPCIDAGDVCILPPAE